MPPRLRSLFFWLHLATGLFAGAIILVLCVTGVALAFEREIVAWAERDVRRATAPSADAVPLPPARLLADFRAAHPGVAVTSLTLSADPSETLALTAGKSDVYHLNQYTGEVRRPGSTAVRDTMRSLVEWHRYLAQSGDARDGGKTLTTAATVAFLVLAVTGLVLWWPRQWSARVLRPMLWLARGARGRARDWNWHHVCGFWALPVIIVLCVSGLVLAQAWANNLAYRSVGEEPQRPGAAQAPVPALAAPAPGTPRLDLLDTLARVQAAYPGWREITVREGLARRPATPPPVEPQSATLIAGDGSPAFVLTQLVLDPHSGEIVGRAGYDDQTTGRKIRTWLRYLHTGQALGWPGQLIAGLASLAGCVLVYTGFALSWRRFFQRRSAASISE